jgi:hypothetical protein
MTKGQQQMHCELSEMAIAMSWHKRTALKPLWQLHPVYLMLLLVVLLLLLQLLWVKVH